MRAHPSRSASADEQHGDGLPWGGKWVPHEVLGPHFALFGTTGTGKTLSIRMLMRAALVDCQRAGALRARAVVYDPKREFVPYLVGMGIPLVRRIRILHPLDRRAYVWNIAADVLDYSSAYEIAALLFPPDENSSQPYFSNAALDIATVAIDALRQYAGAGWTLHELLEYLSSTKRLGDVLELTSDGQQVKELYFATKSLNDVLTTLRTKCAPFRGLARAMHRVPRERYFSLTDWVTDPDFSVLVMSNDETIKRPLDTLNTAMFFRMSNIVNSRLVAGAAPPDTTWFFIDEARRAGDLRGLPELLFQGRSKGVRVVLGFQDIKGMQEVYGAEVAEEIIGLCSNMAFFRLNNPASMEWAESYFAEYEARIKSFSSGSNYGPGGGGTSSGETSTLQTRKAMLKQEFRLFRLATWPPASLGPEFEGAFVSLTDCWCDTTSSAFNSQFLYPVAEGVLPFSPVDISAQNAHPVQPASAKVCAWLDTGPTVSARSASAAWIPLRDGDRMPGISLFPDGSFSFWGVGPVDGGGLTIVAVPPKQWHTQIEEGGFKELHLPGTRTRAEWRDSPEPHIAMNYPNRHAVSSPSHAGASALDPAPVEWTLRYDPSLERWETQGPSKGSQRRPSA